MLRLAAAGSKANCMCAFVLAPARLSATAACLPYLRRQSRGAPQGQTPPTGHRLIGAGSAVASGDVVAGSVSVAPTSQLSVIMTLGMRDWAHGP